MSENQAQRGNLTNDPIAWANQVKEDVKDVDSLEHCLQIRAEIDKMEERLKDYRTIDKLTRKWNWNLEAVRAIYAVADDAHKFLYKELLGPKMNRVKGTKDELTKDMTEDQKTKKLERFQRETAFNEAVEHPKGKWFESMGFRRAKKRYGFTDTWDKRPLDVLFLFPDNIEVNDEVPLIVQFHGGSLMTSACDHEGFFARPLLELAYKQKAIIMAPDYPLGPEANYHDIEECYRDFWTFFSENGDLIDDNVFSNSRTTIQTGEKWETWIIEEHKRMFESKKFSLNLKKDRLMVTGESAGGNAVVISLFKHKPAELPIRVLFLRYPMITHLKREYQKEKDGREFQVTFSKRVYKEDIENFAKDIRNDIYKLEGLRLLPTRTVGHSPLYMTPTTLITTAGFWKELFQRPRPEYDLRSATSDGKDCLETVQDPNFKLNPEKQPPIAIFHGQNDTFCPISDTQQFVDTLIKRHKYKQVFKLDEKENVFNSSQRLLYFTSVTRLESPGPPNDEPQTDVNHGFDTNLWVEKEPFLQDTHSFVEKHWLGV